MKKGVVHIIAVVAVALTLAAGSLAVIATKRTQDLNKNQILSSSDEDSSGSSGSGSSGSSGSSKDDEDRSGSSSREDSGTSGSSGSTTSRTKTETTSPTGVIIRTETKDGETRTELRFGEGERVKIRQEEGRTRTDVVSQGTKVRIQREGDRFVIKAENEAGDQQELAADEIIKIDERLEQDRLKIATESGRLVISRNATFALTDLPISIDLETNELKVTTPAGERVVAILPDQAVQNMLAANVFDRLNHQTIVDEATSGALTSVAEAIRLGEKNGIPIYEIRGLRDQRLLGFIPVTTAVNTTVSAATGEVLDVEQSLLDKIIDLISI